MLGLNDIVVSKTKVRKGIYAIRLKNGGIQIEDQLYLDYPLKDAISLWRKNNPIY